MLLVFSFLALALGPLLVWLARRHAWSTVGLDSFCLLTISGFALLHLLPESAAQGGWLVLPLALVGFLLPTLAERTLHQGHAGMRRTVIALALLGMAAHASLDGLFLADGSHYPDDGHGHTHEVTAWAIILHRIPEGVGIWWIIPRTLGFLPAVLVTAVSVSATLFGYFLGDHVLTDTSQRGLALLQSLLVGSLPPRFFASDATNTPTASASTAAMPTRTSATSPPISFQVSITAAISSSGVATRNAIAAAIAVP